MLLSRSLGDGYKDGLTWPTSMTAIEEDSRPFFSLRKRSVFTNHMLINSFLLQLNQLTALNEKFRKRTHDPTGLLEELGPYRRPFCNISYARLRGST